MRAACLKGGRVSIETLPDPQPRQGQILVRPLFNGICGSDLSLRKQMAAAEVAETDLPIIVPGHEFSAEVLDVLKTVETDLKPGDIITALPFTHDHDGPQTIGISPGHQGGLATLSCVDAVRAFKVPEGVAPDLAALTEPLAVGLHASRLANRNEGPNLVIGCGPVGLAVILSLKLDGRGPIIAADFSAE
ncbi:MAG TPA: alcohol dehydrogenase, partial [Henriciella marina]|nr:alcohol dehydrogenase [Henriciella marina]